MIDPGYDLEEDKLTIYAENITAIVNGEEVKGEDTESCDVIKMIFNTPSILINSEDKRASAHQRALAYERAHNLSSNENSSEILNENSNDSSNEITVRPTMGVFRDYIIESVDKFFRNNKYDSATLKELGWNKDELLKHVENMSDYKEVIADKTNNPYQLSSDHLSLITNNAEFINNFYSILDEIEYSDLGANQTIDFDDPRINQSIQIINNAMALHYQPSLINRIWRGLTKPIRAFIKAIKIRHERRILESIVIGVYPEITPDRVREHTLRLAERLANGGFNRQTRLAVRVANDMAGVNTHTYNRSSQVVQTGEVLLTAPVNPGISITGGSNRQTNTRRLEAGQQSGQTQHRRIAI